MSECGGGRVESDAEAGGRMKRAGESVEVGMQGSVAVGVDLVQPCDGAVRPYPAIVDPFKRRVALREYVRQLRGGNKENERGKECEKLPSEISVPKQKTLGLCKRHVGAAAVAVSGGPRDGMLRDKRKFNAPRQTPEKKQRPDEVILSPGAELPRLVVLKPMVVEDVSADASGGMRQPLFQFASREDVELEPSMGQATVGDEVDVVTGARWSQFGGKDCFSSSNNQALDSYTLSIKRQAQEPRTPTIRKHLAPVNIPVNRQAIESDPSSIEHLPRKPTFPGGLEHNLTPNFSGGSVASGSLFQTASGKPFQASAAAKARAALLFESDAELADFLDLEL